MIDWLLDNLFSVGLGFFIIIAAWLIVRKIFFSGYLILRAPGGYEDVDYYSIPIQERVEFAVFSSSPVVRETSFILDVWAYLPYQYQIVKELAKEINREALLGKKHGVTLERGSILSVSVKIDGLEVPDDKDVIQWEGEPANTSFLVDVPSNTSADRFPGVVVINFEGMMVCKIPFIVKIGSSEEKDYTQISNDAFYPKTAFASYATENREEVLSRIHGMMKIAPDLDVFFDVLSLRSGENWEDKLEQNVPNKDVFYLFWSKYASNSQWVEREWRLALNRRGLEYIDPVPLEDIDNAPPPIELKKLHFYDAYVAYIQYERLKRRQSNVR